jgi:lactate oxidase
MSSQRENLLDGMGAAAAFVAHSAERSLDIINLYDLEAEKVISKGPFGYISGGSGDEWTLEENVRAFYDRQILPRYLAGVEMPETEIVLLGSKVGIPIFVPQMAAHGLAHVTAGKGSAKVAADAGALFCAQALANTFLEDIAKISSGPKWFQLY